MSKNRILKDKKKGIFRKYYKCQEVKARELYIYKQAWTFMPALLGEGENWLDLEYIDSCNLWEKEETDYQAVGRLYAELHQKMRKNELVVCHIDTNPQNIIFAERREKYLLIDFADWRWERAEFDVIHFLLFWGETKKKVEFRKICGEFLAGYMEKGKINKEIWQNLYKRAECCFCERRKRYNRKEKQPSLDKTENRKFLRSINLYK